MSMCEGSRELIACAVVNVRAWSGEVVVDVR